MSATDFFQLVSVSTANFADASVTFGLDYGSEMHLGMYNKHSSAIVEFSSDGTNPIGELDPADGTRGQADDDRKFSKLYFRLKSGSTGPAVVYVKAWVRR